MKFFVYDLDKVIFVDKFATLDDADIYAQNLTDMFSSDVIIGEIPVCTECKKREAA